MERGIAKVNRQRNKDKVPPIERWVVYQLRHSVLSRIRKSHDIESARVLGGHRRLSTTEVYAEADLEKARKVMEEAG